MSSFPGPNDGKVKQRRTYTYGAAQYVYNALNQRVSEDVGGTTTQFAYNVAGQRVSIWNTASPAVAQQEQYYVGSQRVAYFANNMLHFQHQDWTGTERMRTTFNGAVEGTFTSMSFGDAFATVTGSDGDPYHYAMLDHDYSSDTDHAQYRQYSSTPGRWMSPDPYDGSYHMRNPQSFNRYTYALNNPVRFVDPKGLDAEDDTVDPEYDVCADVVCFADTGDASDDDDGGGGGDYSSDPNAPTFSLGTNTPDSTNTLYVMSFLFTPIDTTETPGTGYLSDDDDDLDIAQEAIPLDIPWLPPLPFLPTWLTQDPTQTLMKSMKWSKYPGCSVQHENDIAICQKRGTSSCWKSAYERLAKCNATAGEVGWPPLSQ